MSDLDLKIWNHQFINNKACYWNYYNDSVYEILMCECIYPRSLKINMMSEAYHGIIRNFK